MVVEEIEERNLEVMDHNGLDLEDMETIKDQRQMLTYFEDFLSKNVCKYVQSEFKGVEDIILPL